MLLTRPRITRKLGEGFSWLADSLAAIAGSLRCNKKEDKKEELAGRIKKRVPGRAILKAIGKRKRNEEKVKDIFVVVPKRGVMLKLKVEEIKNNSIPFF